MSWLSKAFKTITGQAGADAAKDAAGAQLQGVRESNALQKEMFEKSLALQAPWREAGTRALNVLEKKINAGPGEFNPENEPGYQFGYGEFVEKPTLAMASATGRLGSGRTQKELTRYASDYASTKYDNFLDRWLKSLSPYQSMAGVGQSSAAQGSSQATNLGTSLGANAIYGGEARGSGYINAANAYGQGLKNVLDIGKTIALF